MKTSVGLLFYLSLCSWGPLLAQTILPVFLEGTWKIENQEIYEHWEILEDGSLTGESYKMNNDEKVVTEHLEIHWHDDDIIYTATVLNQNNGKGIDFTLYQLDSLTWSFENPEHDFPKVIQYQKRSDSDIYVMVSDGEEKGFAYVIRKVDK